jgi:Ca2+/H+ antiporter
LIFVNRELLHAQKRYTGIKFQGGKIRKKEESMNRIAKKTMAMLLTAFLLLSMLPPTARAASRSLE